MGILSAALEMLEMEDENDEEELSFDLELEQNLYTVLEETMSRIESLPESESVSYQKDDPRWRQFGILLRQFAPPLQAMTQIRPFRQMTPLFCR